MVVLAGCADRSEVVTWTDEHGRVCTGVGVVDSDDGDREVTSIDCDYPPRAGRRVRRRGSRCRAEPRGTRLTPSDAAPGRFAGPWAVAVRKSPQRARCCGRWTDSKESAVTATHGRPPASPDVRVRVVGESVQQLGHPGGGPAGDRPTSSSARRGRGGRQGGRVGEAGPVDACRTNAAPPAARRGLPGGPPPRSWRAALRPVAAARPADAATAHAGAAPRTLPSPGIRSRCRGGRRAHPAGTASPRPVARCGPGALRTAGSPEVRTPPTRADRPVRRSAAPPRPREGGPGVTCPVRNSAAPVRTARRPAVHGRPQARLGCRSGPVRAAIDG